MCQYHEGHGGYEIGKKIVVKEFLSFLIKS